jgi:hypothetical protein
VQRIKTKMSASGETASWGNRVGQDSIIPPARPGVLEDRRDPRAVIRATEVN